MSGSRFVSMAAGLAVFAGGTSCIVAQPAAPSYSLTVTDAVTSDNQFAFGSFRFWDVDAGADSYQNDIYERPVAQSFNPVGGRYAANEYFAYVDIERARFGFDNRWMYVSIDLVGLDKRTQDGVNTIEGLQGRYGVRFGADPDGRNSIYLFADQPQSAGLPNTARTLAKTEGFRDTDRDVGGRGGPIHGQAGPSGLGVTKVDNITEEFGLNGYDQQFISTDGLLVNGQRPVLWQRVNPTDNTVVELAFDYVTAGLLRSDLDAIQYLHFEAQQGGNMDPQWGLWNDQFTGIESGSPNAGIGSDNEFGIQGLGAISGVGTVRAALVTQPPPTPGACCIVSICSIVTPEACTSAGGRFLGAASACSPVSCCIADANRDGVTNVGDVFEFLNAFFAAQPAADITGDGRVDAADLFAYITAFFAGC